jgi:hypothetical protein
MEEFISDEIESSKLPAEPTPDRAPNRESVKMVLFGSRRGIAHVIHHQHVLGFIEAGAWSKPQMVPNRQDEWMSVAVKHLRM